MRKILSNRTAPHGTRFRLSRVLVAGVTVIAASLCLAVALMAGGCSGQSQTMVKAAEAQEAGALTTAVSLYREQLKNDPENPAAIKALAVDLYMLNLWDEALPMQEKAVALDRKDAQTRIELGFNYMNHQDAAADAVRVMKEAADIEPSAKYLTFLGQAELKSGDLAAAEQALREAIATDKTYGHAYTVLADVLQLQGKDGEAAQLLQTASSAK